MEVLPFKILSLILSIASLLKYSLIIRYGLMTMRVGPMKVNILLDLYLSTRLFKISGSLRTSISHISSYICPFDIKNVAEFGNSILIGPLSVIASYSTISVPTGLSTVPLMNGIPSFKFYGTSSHLVYGGRYVCDFCIQMILLSFS